MPSFGSMFASLTLESASFMSGLDAARKSLGNTQKTFERIGASMAKTGALMTAGITAPLAVFGKGAFDAASDAAELQSSFDQTFGSMSVTMGKWAEATGDAMGRSTQEMQKAANTFGIFFNQAVDPAKAAEMSQTFAELAQDLGSFFNVDTDTAIEKLRSGLSGESEPLRDFGVFLTEATVKAKGLEMGLTGVGNEFTEQEKVLARYAIIMAQTTKAQGDVERTSGGTANQVRAARAAFDELQVIVGTKLLPVLTPLVTKVGEGLAWFTQLPAPVQTAAVAVVTLGAAVGPVVIGIGGLVTGVGAILPVLAALRVAVISQAVPAFASFVVATAPVTLPILAASAAIAGIVLAVRNWEQIKPYVDRVVGWMGNLYTGVKTWVFDKLNAVWRGVKAGIESVKGSFFALYDAVVGHSYIPDMVDGIGAHMARLDGNMVAPTHAATDSARRAFEALGQAVAPILDRLFPDQARINRFRQEMDSLLAFAKEAGWSIEQTAEAVRRLRNEQDGKAPDAPGILDTPAPNLPDADAGIEGLARTTEEATQRIIDANTRQRASWIETMRDSLGSVRAFVDHLKSGDILGALQSVMDVIAQVADAIRGTSTPATRTFPVGGMMSFAGARANGGPVMPRRSYLVGERGPEILRMGGQGGSIVANDDIGTGVTGRIVIEEAPGFASRVVSISDNVSVERIGQNNRASALRGRQALGRS